MNHNSIPDIPFDPFLSEIGGNINAIQREAMMSRQAGIIPGRLGEMSFLLIGLGAIGSNVAYTLGSMGATQFELWDPDVVAMENIFPAHFTMEQVGQPKVEAVKDDLVNNLGLDPALIVTRQEEFRDEPPILTPEVVICSPDSLRARRSAWDLIHMSGMYDLWIDARMGGTSVTVHSVLKSDDEDLKERYNRTLQGGGYHLPCGQKATALLTKGMIPQLVMQSVYDYALGRPPQYGASYDASNRRLVQYDK